MDRTWRFFFRNVSLSRMLLFYIPCSALFAIVVPVIQAEFGPPLCCKTVEILGFVAILCCVVKIEAIIIRMKLTRYEERKDPDRDSF